MHPEEEYDPITDTYVLMEPCEKIPSYCEKMTTVYMLWRWKDHDGGPVELWNGTGWEDPVDWSDWIHTPTVKYLSLNVNV